MCACNDRTRPTEVMTSQQLADIHARAQEEQGREAALLIASVQNALANAGGGSSNAGWYAAE